MLPGLEFDMGHLASRRFAASPTLFADTRIGGRCGD
jgi:hypothetical protein